MIIEMLKCIRDSCLSLLLRSHWISWRIFCKSIIEKNGKYFNRNVASVHYWNESTPTDDCLIFDSCIEPSPHYIQLIVGSHLAQCPILSASNNLTKTFRTTSINSGIQWNIRTRTLSEQEQRHNLFWFHANGFLFILDLHLNYDATTTSNSFITHQFSDIQRKR